MPTTTTITLKRPHPAQVDVLTNSARFRVLACGRRFGKTELAIIAVINRMLRGQACWFCSPTYRNSERVYRNVKGLLSQVVGIYTNDSKLRVEMPTGGWCEFVSLNDADNLRGEGLAFVVVDEAAYVKAGAFDAVIRPMLLTDKGDALILSSPNGRNWFYQAYQQGLDPAVSDWQAWHYTSYDNPLVDPAELDEIRRNTPARVFEQEYLAQFLDDGGAVFRNLQACVQDAPASSGDIVFGVDWGRVDDYTVIAALDAQSGAVLEIDRYNQVDWQLQRGRLMSMYERWRPRTVLAESNSIGQPNIEELQRAGLPVVEFTTTAGSKSQVINQLALAFEQSDILIPNDPTLLGELQAYTVERLPSGNLRYTAPSGLHDDMVMALALAWHARVNYGRLILW